MKKPRVRIQCKCQACGKVWMDRQQRIFCPDCIESHTQKWNMQCAGYVEAAKEQYGASVGGALQLYKDGSLPKMTWVPDQNKAFAAFLGMLNGYNYVNGGKG